MMKAFEAVAILSETTNAIHGIWRSSGGPDGCDAVFFFSSAVKAQGPHMRREGRQA
ncbi:hypothetical protein PZA11_004479 [Diplocarpon coronariae]